MLVVSQLEVWLIVVMLVGVVTEVVVVVVATAHLILG